MPRQLTRSLLLMLLLLISPPSVKGKRRQAQKQKMATKKQCGEVECADVHSDGRDNCILKCTSPACYEEIYAADELEPGERERGHYRRLERVEAVGHRAQHLSGNSEVGVMSGSVDALFYF
jgi:hypothetical protein